MALGEGVRTHANARKVSVKKHKVGEKHKHAYLARGSPVSIRDQWEGVMDGPPPVPPYGNAKTARGVV